MDEPHSLDPSPEEMRRLGYAAVDRIVEHLEALRDARVVTPPDAAEFERRTREPLPDAPRPLDASVDHFFREIMPRATLVNHPRFFAYVPGPGSFAGSIGDFVASATNCFVGTFLGGAIMTQLEAQVIDWLSESLELPSGCAGLLTTGGSMANLTAIAAARSRSDNDPNRVRVITSDESHYSVAKAARVLGIAPERIHQVASDPATQAMDFVACERELARDGTKIVVATMGTTSTGAVDPIDRIADAANGRDDVWLHIDGAYGAAMALLPERRDLRSSLARADSLTLDPHKWLYAPFESGCIITRHPGALRAAFAADGAYMQDVPRDAINPFEFGPELSRGNRALKLWTLFRSVGFDAIRDAIRRDVALCRLAHDLLREDPRIEIVTSPAMSVFSFTLRGALEAAAPDLVQHLFTSGFMMLSSTRVAERFAIRWCVVNHRTTRDDIEACVQYVREAIDGLQVD